MTTPLAITPIDASSPLPKYRQLADLIRARIVRGEWAPGQRIPSEAELQAAHKISRITIRQALAELEQDGLIERVPGIGTFVRKRSVHIERSVELSGFGENMAALGMEPGYRTLRAEPAPISPEIAFRLKTPPNRAFVIERLLLADGEPVARHESYLPHWVVKQAGAEALSGQALDRKSLYRTLGEAGIQMHWAEEIVEPGLAERRDAAHLHMDEGALVLRVTRIVFNERNDPIEYVRLVYNAGVYTYRTTLYGKQRAPQVQ
ncbi:MAG TPA: GntR family transcriptional regulator [Thermomicrobiales bacterium]|nr:GntR family transcriptional regulator [Thermomicrobiales bacterium]